MKFNKDMLLLYAITDQQWAVDTPLYRQVESALKGGATMIQLREKELAERRIHRGSSCHRRSLPSL